MPEKYVHILRRFYQGYCEALGSASPAVFHTFLDLVIQQVQSPFLFPPYHQHVCEPFDYYQFGIQFIKPLVRMEASSIHGLVYLEEIAHFLEHKENVIFFANHQTEADPQAISILLEERYPKIGKEMIFVAGERVLTDPLAIPFSMGRNLLCIYSKRHIDHPPEQRAQKQLHNRRTMELMRHLLSQGGQCIYIAPSGGRDRANAEGLIEPALFDPKSIEMVYLMAQRSGKPTHFYPMALATYELLPPPQTVEVTLGEMRLPKRAAIQLALDKEIDMEAHPKTDKQDLREARADSIWHLVTKNYHHIKR